MKQALLFVFMISLCVPCFMYADSEKNEKDEQAKKVALETVVALIEDIAKLVDNKKHEKDPELTKAVCLDLVTRLVRLADVVTGVVIRIKERKEMRSIDLYSDDDYQNELYALAVQLAEKSMNLQP